jgi:hypothetical protein
MEEELVWQTLIEHEDYEICTSYPHQIMKKEDKRIIHEHLNHQGYVRCHLNINGYSKHRIIAEQFISNPENLP